jgi:hypothetical protein
MMSHAMLISSLYESRAFSMFVILEVLFKGGISLSNGVH